MFKTIVRVVSIALIFLAVCWIAGSSWYQFKHDIDLKNPLDVFHINTPSLEEPDTNLPQIPEVDAKDTEKEDEKEKDDDSKDKDTQQTEDKKTDNKKEETSTTKGITKEELENLIGKIRISNESQNIKYDREKFEKPTHSYKFNNQKLTRNKYAWHISEYLNSEDPFSYKCPYTGINIKDMSTLDFEHIIPLNYIHKYGDVKWNEQGMNTYAYDMRIGMDVLNKANRSHSDKGPSEWLPEQNIAQYCYTWLVIAYEYDIALRNVDLQIIKLECLNDLEHCELINPFIKNCDEYELQQEWIKDIDKVMKGKS